MTYILSIKYLREDGSDTPFLTLASSRNVPFTVTRREVADELDRNSRQLAVALDVWIDRSELDTEQSALRDSLRALCLHRARELYAERALLRLALRRLNAGTAGAS